MLSYQLMFPDCEYRICSVNIHEFLAPLNFLRHSVVTHEEMIVVYTHSSRFGTGDPHHWITGVQHADEVVYGPSNLRSLHFFRHVDT